MELYHAMTCFIAYWEKFVRVDSAPPTGIYFCKRAVQNICSLRCLQTHIYGVKYNYKNNKVAKFAPGKSTA